MGASTRRVHELQAGVLKAMSHPTRLAVIDLLAQREYAVQEVAEQLRMNPTMASRHLAQMRSAGLLSCHKDKQQVKYALSYPCVLQIVSLVRELLRRNLEAASRNIRTPGQRNDDSNTR